MTLALPQPIRISQWESGASPAGWQGGQCPPIFFLPPPRYFFGRKKLVFLGEKNVKICDFGQKKSSDFGEDLFFWRSPAFGRKICDFGQKKPSHFGENLCPPDFNFAPPPELAKLATPLMGIVLSGARKS